MVAAGVVRSVGLLRTTLLCASAEGATTESLPNSLLVGGGMVIRCERAAGSRAEPQRPVLWPLPPVDFVDGVVEHVPDGFSWPSSNQR